MSGLSREEANQLAAILNQLCMRTLQALEGSEAERQRLTAALAAYQQQFDEGSEVGAFVLLLVRWLAGQRPAPSAADGLATPFQRALQVMLERHPAETRRAPVEEEEQPPISRHVLSQLVSAVVAAAVAGDVPTRRRLATHLVTVQGALDDAWRARLGPLLENLRATLDGAPLEGLPPVPDPEYQRLWQGAVELLLEPTLAPEQAEAALLDRLVHNSLYVLRGGDETLRERYLRALQSFQEQALESDRPQIVALVAAIRARFLGLDPAPFTFILDGTTRDAWLRLLAAAGEDGKENESA